MRGFLFTAFCLILTSQAFSQSLPETDIFLLPVTKSGDSLRFGKPVNVSHHEGYDNQPAFWLEKNLLLFTSIRDTPKQAEAYGYSLKKGGEPFRITHTTEDEYSPTPLAGENAFSVVRVEKDSSQRLWKFPLKKGEPKLLLANNPKVGYHCWLSKSKLALFVLGKSFSLQLADIKDGFSVTVDSNIGRCILKTPDGKSLTYVKKYDANDWRIQQMNIVTGQVQQLARCLQGAEDFCWTPDGKLLMGSGGRLYQCDPRKTQDWYPIADFSKTEIGDFYRLQMSKDGKWLALVGFKGKKP